MKKIIFILSFLVLVTAFVPLTLAQQIPMLELYHGRDCPHCHKELKWLPKLGKMYPDLKVEKYEVWYDEANKKRFETRMAQLGKEASAVPTNVINDEVIVGFDADAIIDLMKKHYGAPEIEFSEIEEMPWYKRFFRWLFQGKSKRPNS